jgi:Immunity protein 49
MQKIPRHSLSNIEFIVQNLDFLNETFTEDLPHIQQHPENFGTVSCDLADAVSISVLAGRSKEETINYMQMALAFGLGNFQSALHPGESLVINLKEQQLNFKGVETKAYIDPIQWTKLFYLAVILRDQDSVRNLTSIPESLMKQANLRGVEADYAIVRFHKGIYDPNADIAQLLIEAMLATDPKNYTAVRGNYFLDLKVPELTLYRCIFSDEPEEYNKNLAEAINSHEKFWGNEEKAYDKEGWLAYSLIAASVIAFGAKKYPIEVDSPYLPMWLVKGEF